MTSPEAPVIVTVTVSVGLVSSTILYVRLPPSGISRDVGSTVTPRSLMSVTLIGNVRLTRSSPVTVCEMTAVSAIPSSSRSAVTVISTGVLSVIDCYRDPA